MQIGPTNLTVADYCNGLERGEIQVNHEYQRSDKVWPAAARSFLVETILLNYPIPKMFLYQVTDLKSRQTIKEIVDGQQRSKAIFDFFQGKYRLSRSLSLEDARNRTYAQLDDALKAQFLNYVLDFEMILAATPDEVTEIFRRMNLFTVPLNPEEQRHAVFQGALKWFMHGIARQYVDSFASMGLFSQKQLVRMADTKLLAEIIHAYLNGFETTTKAKLDAMYRAKDKEFPESTDVEERLNEALTQLIEWSDVHETSLMKPHQVYALLLALMHVRRPIPQLSADFPSPGLDHLDAETCIPNLTAMAEALDNAADEGAFGEFVAASSEQTNVATQRAIRFRWFCRALTEGHM